MYIYISMKAYKFLSSLDRLWRHCWDVPALLFLKVPITQKDNGIYVSNRSASTTSTSISRYTGQWYTLHLHWYLKNGLSMNANTLDYLRKSMWKIPFTKIIMSLETICCGCNVFTMAKITTGIEIGLHIIYGFYVPIKEKLKVVWPSHLSSKQKQGPEWSLI